MKICIIGGGPTALSAAYYLSKEKNYSIKIFNASNSLGGLASSFSLSNNSKIEKYYHHIFKTDKEFLYLSKLLKNENKIRFKKASIGHFFNNKLYDISDAKKLLFSDLLSLKGILNLIFGYVYVKVFWRNNPSLSAYDGSKRFFGKEVTNKIWGPLLRGKFAEYIDLVPFSWLVSRIRDRTPSLGYFENGFITFYNSLENKLLENGVFVNNENKISKLIKDGEGFLVNNEKFDFVINTIGPNQKLVPGENKNFYGLGAICAIYELNMNPNIPYWTNYCMDDNPALAIINHRELEKGERFGNLFPVYVAAYINHKKDFFKYSNKEIELKFSEALCKVMNIDENKLKSLINVVHINKSRYAQPLINPFLNLNPIEIYKKNYISVSMHSIYPNDRGQNYAFKYGRKAANYILKRTK